MVQVSEVEEANEVMISIMRKTYISPGTVHGPCTVVQVSEVEEANEVMRVHWLP